MLSREDAPRRRGRQEPSFSIIPKWDYTDGADASELAEGYGLTPDPWQAAILDAWLARTEDDRFAASRAGLAVPRQNGKNGVLEMRELYGMCICGECILHTAHEVKTSRKAFLRLCSFFENERKHPDMAEMVKTIRKTNGQEAILLTNGGGIEFSARSSGAARGFSVDLVVLDEAQCLTDDHMAALMPTLSAAPHGDRQLIFTGTPPYGNGGEVWQRLHDEAHGAAPSPRLAWHEWAAGEFPDNPADPELWYLTNPGMGIRLTEEFTAEELATMGRDSFARERLGWWAEKAACAVVAQKTWDGAEGAKDGAGRVSVGIKFSADGLACAVCACEKAGEARFVELVSMETANAALDRLPAWLMERKTKIAAVAIDGKAHSTDLRNRIKALKPPRAFVMAPDVQNIIAANSAFVNHLEGGRLAHAPASLHGQELLADAVCKAKRRDIGGEGGFGWQSTEFVEAAPAEAAALAVWAADNTRRNPQRKARVTF